MILDQISQIETYRNISPKMTTAVDYITSHDLKALNEGSHQIDGQDVLINIMSYDTKKSSEARFEAHRRYIDIQIVLQGGELCYCRPLSGLPELAPFDDRKDIGFYHGSDGVDFPLEEGNFAIFFPQDAHMPSCDLRERCRIRKAVVKVAV